MRRWPPTPAPLSAAFALAAAMTGCTPLTTGTLEPEDFVSPGAMAPGAAVHSPAPEVVSGREARAGILSIGTHAGPPAIDPTAPPQERIRDLYDAKVGEVSGRSIFVNGFLEPLEAQLEQEGKTLSLAAWRTRARQAIEDRLRGIVFDELLSDEGLSLLTPVQRTRLSSISDVWRARLLSQNFGSIVLTEERMMAERGLTVNQYLAEQRRALLIQYVMDNEVKNKVTVTLDDIRRAYQADFARFNPPGTVAMRQIEVRAGDAEAAARIEGALAAGTPFAEVASGPDNIHNRSSGGLIEAQLSGDFATEVVHANAELDRILHTLGEGGHAGPIPTGPTISWIALEAIRRTTVSLEEAQLTLSEEIRRSRSNAEQQKFLLRLMERAGFSEQDFARMSDELFAVALARYGPEP